MRSYAVVGVGAIGGLYGARLAAAGHDVQFVLRSDADHVLAHGLRVDSPDGDVFVPSPRVVRQIEELAPVDTVLVALKTTADAELHAMVPALAARSRTIVLLQNGVGNEDRVAAHAGSGHQIDDDGVAVVAGLCFTCSSKVGPGHIVHEDYGAITVAQWTPDGSAAGATDVLVDLVGDLVGSGTETSIQDDLRTARWRKLVWNAPFNGLSVILRTGTAEMLADDASRALAETTMAEVVAIAAADGHPVEDGLIPAMVANTSAMRPYLPSMRLDFDAGRPMEVEAIYTRPLEIADRLGVAAPTLRTLERQLRFLDRTRGLDR